MNEFQQIKMHVFIHSHFETGLPLSVNVLDIDGKIHMDWFENVFTSVNDADLSKSFSEHSLQGLDAAEWYEVQPMVEVGDGFASDWYLEVLGVVAEDDE